MTRAAMEQRIKELIAECDETANKLWPAEHKIKDLERQLKMADEVIESQYLKIRSLEATLVMYLK